MSKRRARDRAERAIVSEWVFQLVLRAEVERGTDPSTAVSRANASKAKIYMLEDSRR